MDNGTTDHATVEERLAFIQRRLGSLEVALVDIERRVDAHLTRCPGATAEDREAVVR